MRAPQHPPGACAGGATRPPQQPGPGGAADAGTGCWGKRLPPTGVGMLTRRMRMAFSYTVTVCLRSQCQGSGWEKLLPVFTKP